MFKFSIRDVLWLMLTVGLAVGWLVDHRTLNHNWQERVTTQFRYRMDAASDANHVRSMVEQCPTCAPRIR